MSRRARPRDGALCALLLAAALAGLAAPGCGAGPPVPYYQGGGPRGADRDGDGIADIDDACPDDAEDGLPPKANDGCPATDPDNDGVMLADDRCPDAKEDGLPPYPADGCPMADADGDGVADALDRCPTQAEDNLPPDPNDGCPAPDTDGDGIADALDQCPTEPETLNGYRDDDGCPDTPPQQVAFDESSSTIFIPEGKRIDFDSDSAEVAAAAQPTIAAVAQVLKAHPEVQRLEIEGHASSKGDAQYNVTLTERRAQAVGRALVKHGVEPTRLVPIGYGEYCPAVDAGDDVDEPRNRRVLLKAVQVNGVWQPVPRGCWKAQASGINPTRRRPGIPATPPPLVVRPSGGA